MTKRTNAFPRWISFAIGIAAIAVAGCSGDPVCDQAEAHAIECLPKGSGAATSKVSSQVCEGVYACTSKCVLDAPCKGLSNADTDAGTAYVDCTKKCSPDAGPEDGGS